VNLGPVIGLWNRTFIPNDMRNFLFLERNNRLLTNNRANALNPDTDPNCTFCKIKGVGIRDGFGHLFFTCNTTNTLKLGVENIVGPTSIYEYWFGLNDDKVNLETLLIWETFRYVIWKNKQRRRLPNLVIVISEMCTILKIMSKLNKFVGTVLKNPLARCMQALG